MIDSHSTQLGYLTREHWIGIEGVPSATLSYVLKTSVSKSIRKVSVPSRSISFITAYPYFEQRQNRKSFYQVSPAGPFLTLSKRLKFGFTNIVDKINWMYPSAPESGYTTGTSYTLGRFIFPLQGNRRQFVTGQQYEFDGCQWILLGEDYANEKPCWKITSRPTIMIPGDNPLNFRDKVAPLSRTTFWIDKSEGVVERVQSIAIGGDESLYELTLDRIPNPKV